MPIPVKQLQDRARPLRDRVLEFLQANPDDAFAIHEIWGAMNNIPTASFVGLALAMMAVPTGKRLPELEAVEALVHDRLIERKVLGGVDYFYYATSKS